MWQWKNQRPGLSAKNSMSSFLLRTDGETVFEHRVRGVPLARLWQDAEEVAVQVHRVVHHRGVGEPDPHPVAELNLERLGVVPSGEYISG